MRQHRKWQKDEKDIVSPALIPQGNLRTLNLPKELEKTVNIHLLPLSLIKEHTELGHSAGQFQIHHKTW